MTDPNTLIKRLASSLRVEDKAGTYTALLNEADKYLSGLQKPNPLNVPWYGQNDSATDMGWRMCFSSSCAMLVAFLRGAVLIGPNGDDQYLRRVLMYGDTTDSSAQVKALDYYGITAKFITNGNFSIVEKQIDAGIPVPVGWYHRGPISAPRGGHWCIIVGYTKEHLIVHDPNGEANLVTGETLSKPARFCKYSRKNFGVRWQAEGPSTGWAIIAEK